MSRTRFTPEQVQSELAETARSLPIFEKLASLFKDKKMFDSFSKFEDEGFKLVAHAEHKAMAGTHKSAPGYIFKKYNNDKPGKKQLLNYLRRVEGARILRTFIAEQGFSHVVAPKKWLYELPSSFPERYLVVAEKLDLVDERSTLSAYDRIGKEQTRELATILYYFRGMNSTAKNLPYTKDDKIAFIDTERWANDKDLLRKVGDRLPSDRKSQAEAVFKELRRSGARQYHSAFK